MLPSYAQREEVDYLGRPDEGGGGGGKTERGVGCVGGRPGAAGAPPRR
jgi:hypothetical protein